MTQSLYLLRHAKAEPWIPGIDDFARELSQRGIDHMRHLSDWTRHNLQTPDAVLCSASKRTRETLRPFFDAWPGVDDRTVYTREVYEATKGNLHALAGAAFGKSQILMMVGHNPGFEYFAQSVLQKSDATRMAKMATGTLAVIDFEVNYEASCGNGLLRHWVKRSDLSVQ